MSTLFQRHIIKAAGAIGLASAMIAATPAIANTSTSASAAEVTKPVEEAQGQTLTQGDPKFREAFAQWVSLDDKGPEDAYDRTTTTDFVRTVVAVPSGMPLRGATLTSSYGMRTHPVLRQRRAHKGVDLAAPTGTPIYATADGVVTRADWFSSYGLYISIDHGADLETRFAHLSRLAVGNGERVKKGDLIGYVGSTGRSTGPHLHYEVRVSGVAVNPIPYMNETSLQMAYNAGSSDSAGE
jgi:murein DD-endopeptidase MepM/ murein hydrolase activator NlpD